MIHRDVRVRCSIGKTLNLGNYESMRLDIAMEVRDADVSAEDLYEEVREFVVTKLKEEIEECQRDTK